MKFHQRPLILLTILMLMVSLACSLPFSLPSLKSASTGTPASNGKKVTKLTDVQKAVIQIESQGTFLDPEVGLEVNAAGRGSGFIIDPSGLAVTNNHVVTGAALVKVWINGETEARNARVIAYSECNDLALIKIDGSGFNYLDWYDGDIQAGQEIYLAGFPLGEPEYSLTKGIISKEHTSGNTSWTAIDGGVLAHDATSNPGNSGGPIVNSEGQVLGVNFASLPDANQYFAIPAKEAKAVVDKLKDGINFESIGVNGTVVSNDDQTITGTWVSSVASGSPADKAGLKAGDIITQIEGLVVGTDGTMGDYCSVIRTHDANATLAITVLRYPTGEILEGQINGRTLEVTGNFKSSSSSSGSSSNSGGSSSGGSTTVSGDGSVKLFTDDFNGNLSNYKVFFLGTDPSTNDVGFSTSNGKLLIDVNGEFNPYIYYSGEEYGNSVVDTVVYNPPSGQSQTTKLICRYEPDNSWYEFDFIVSEDGYGYYQIMYWTLAGTVDFVDLTEFESNDNIGTGDTDEYTAACTGNQLSLYVDQNKVTTITDNRLSSAGYSGIGMSSYQTSFTGAFDLLQIGANNN